jgi:hypothetical protein
MRRVLIVSIAILVVMFATTAVRAGEQQVSDRLLEILKERQIISESEYAELSDVASQMQEDQSAVDQRLTALDASITEYLAKEGDDVGVATKHKKGTGFGMESGNFSLWIGGLFQFEYYGVDVKNGQDTNNFRVKQARFYFMGKAFVEGFTYKFQWEGAGSGVTLRDAYGNYEIAEGIQVRFGQFKVPYSRQELTSSGKLEFMNRSIVVQVFAPGRDIGVMGWDEVAFGDSDMTLEWAFGLFNGDGTNVSGNDNNWLGWVARVGFYPMGMVKYSEGDLDPVSDVQFGFAGSYYSVRNRPAGNTVKTDAWQLEGVVTWNGLYAEGEYHHAKVNPDGASSMTHSGWFLQGGFLIPNSDFEVLARYSYIDWDSDTGLKNTKEWVLGAAWYPNGFGHPFKIVVQFGQVESDDESGGSSFSSPSTFDYGIDYSEFYDYLERVRFIRAGFQLDW